MTIDEFNKTGFTGNMFCMYQGKKMFVMSVDFTEALFGLTEEKADIPPEEWSWVRCENVELINGDENE